MDMIIELCVLCFMLTMLTMLLVVSVQDIPGRPSLCTIDEQKPVDSRMELPGWCQERERLFKAANPQADGRRSPHWGGCLEDFREEKLDLLTVKDEPDEPTDNEDMMLKELGLTGRVAKSAPGTAAAQTAATAVSPPQAVLSDRQHGPKKMPQKFEKPEKASMAAMMTVTCQSAAASAARPCPEPEGHAERMMPGNCMPKPPGAVKAVKPEEVAKPVSATRPVARHSPDKLKSGGPEVSPKKEMKTEKDVPGAGVGVAHSLAEGLNFTEFYLDELARLPCESLPGDYMSALDLIADRMDNACETDSTSFSGVEAPMCSRKMLHRALEVRLGRAIRAPKLLHMIEWDAGCQNELLSMDDDACLFGDISIFFRDEISELIAGLKKNPALALETLAPLLEQKTLVKRRAFCLRHQSLICSEQSTVLSPELSRPCGVVVSLLCFECSWTGCMGRGE